MAYRIQRFEAPLQNGVQYASIQISPHLNVDFDSYNMLKGISNGPGPRYGMSPVPGHSHTDWSTAGVVAPPAGLMQSEATTNAYTDRLRVFGVLPISLGTFSDTTTKRTHYVWACASTHGVAGLYFDFNMSSVNSGYQTQYDPYIGSGLSSENLYGIYAYDLQYINCDHFDSTNLRKIKSDVINCRLASIFVSGQDNPAPWIAGKKFANGDATHTTIPSFDLNFAAPPEFFTRKYKLNSRNIRIFELYKAGGVAPYKLMRELQYNNWTIVNGTYSSVDEQFTAKACLNLTGAPAATVIARLDGTTPTEYANVGFVGIYDTGTFINSSYTALLAAPGKAICCILQEDRRAILSANLNQWVDLTNRRTIYPKDLVTVDAAGVPYKEDLVPKHTCWNNWPTFLTGVATGKDVAAAYNGIIMVTLGGPGSGILRKNTAYEVAFSLYLKNYGYETNVGTPARIMTTTDDFVALSLHRYEADGSGNDKQIPPSQFAYSPFPDFSAYAFANYIQVRVYYRQLGTYEWLPALVYDAARHIADPNVHILWACQGAIAGLPGGQPGAFNDYSELPSDEYTDVCTFQNRSFWCSKKNLVFSLRNNIFCYPLRNSVPCPTGEFRGFIVHTFYGQSEQASRLVIFGSKATYFGRFTGNFTQQPVTISPTVTATFDVDGSDFLVEDWTSFTAFSSRSAIIADGLLYWWGPQGIFRDNGVNIPERISIGLEPAIFTLYDANKTDDIFASFDPTTKEITWFYSPRENGFFISTLFTSGIVYNTRTGQFDPVSYRQKLDWAQPLNIENSNVTRNIAGSRTLIGTRISGDLGIQYVQRAFFYDLRNRSGDISPQTEFLVKTVGAITDSQIVLTLGKGYTPSTYNQIQIGSAICIQQAVDYSENALTTDLIGRITAFGAGTITVALPKSVTTYFAGTLAGDKYFPVWIDQINTIYYRWHTTYWAPSGLQAWAYWLSQHLLFKVKLLPTAAPETISLGYRTPISKEMLVNALTLVDNSDGNCQIYTDLKNQNQSFEGQGIKYKLFGAHIGNEWALQYLAADATLLEGDNLKMFEG